MDYSQHNIETYLRKLYPDQQSGYFVEVGCWDGTIISQTKYLEEQGWTGLCIDPFPQDFTGRTCKVIPVAVGNSVGSRAFVKVSIDRRHGGDVSYFSGFLSDIKTHLELIADHCDFEIVQVTCEKLTDVLNREQAPKFIEFLSVDTEGSEIGVFKSIDFEQHTFGVIVFEHNEEAYTKDIVGQILGAQGYIRVAELRCDDVYIHGHTFADYLLKERSK